MTIPSLARLATMKPVAVPTPCREIRAQHTADTIVVYQAYCNEIGLAAAEQHRLDASPKFSTSRMTWIKPSWAWMMYRSGYSYKDPRQECILAISLRKDVFISLLENAVVASAQNTDICETQHTDALPRVRVQWDPERTIRLEKLPYRSIQIGVPGERVKALNDGIVNIRNVTEQARELKQELDNNKDVTAEALQSRGLITEETTFSVSERLSHLLDMA